jgi:hypothetical protein
MNVSRTIDWRHMSLKELVGRRFIGQLWSGAMLDSHLTAAKPLYVTDSDDLTVVIRHGPHGMEINQEYYKSINVLEETE